MLTGHLLGSDGGLGVDEVRLELREVRHDVLVRILGRYSRYIYFIYLQFSLQHLHTLLLPLPLEGEPVTAECIRHGGVRVILTCKIFPLSQKNIIYIHSQLSSTVCSSSTVPS